MTITHTTWGVDDTWGTLDQTRNDDKILHTQAKVKMETFETRELSLKRPQQPAADNHNFIFITSIAQVFALTI